MDVSPSRGTVCPPLPPEPSAQISRLFQLSPMFTPAPPLHGVLIGCGKAETFGGQKKSVLEDPAHRLVFRPLLPPGAEVSSAFPLVRFGRPAFGVITSLKETKNLNVDIFHNIYSFEQRFFQAAHIYGDLRLCYKLCHATAQKRDNKRNVIVMEEAQLLL